MESTKVIKLEELNESNGTYQCHSIETKSYSESLPRTLGDFLQYVNNPERTL